MTVGQSAGGPLRRLALLAPRGQSVVDDGPNGFPVNKTAATAGVTPALTGAGWRLASSAASSGASCRSDGAAGHGAARARPADRLRRGLVDDAALERRAAARPRRARRRARAARSCTWSRCSRAAVLRRATLGHAQHRDERALLALRVNGADLSLDHGYPARIIVPALPGVHCTKWVASLTLGGVVIARAPALRRLAAGTSSAICSRSRSRSTPSAACSTRASRADSTSSSGSSAARSSTTSCSCRRYSALDAVARRAHGACAARRAGDQPPALPGGDLGRAAARLLPARSSPRADGNYVRATGHHVTGYAARWLAITAGLFRASGVVYLVRVRAHALEHPVRPPGDEDVARALVDCDRVRLAHGRPAPQHVGAAMSGELDELVAARERDVQPPADRSSARPYGPPGRP